MKGLIFTILIGISFSSVAHLNVMKEKVDTVFCQEIEIQDEVFFKAISIFKDSLQNRFSCNYCSSVFIYSTVGSKIQFDITSFYKTKLFIQLSNWPIGYKSPPEMALCSFVWNDIRFFTRKDILGTLGIAYQVVNQNFKLTINDFKKKETLSKSCVEMDERLIGIHAHFYFYREDDRIVNPYFEIEKDYHTGE